MWTPTLLIALIVGVSVVTASPISEVTASDPQDLKILFTSTTTARPFIPVISRNEVRDEAGQIALTYQSGDGTAVEQVGVLKPSEDPKKKILVQKGSYSYISPDGTPIQVSWIADERGFRPVGSHILVGDVPAVVPAVPAAPPKGPMPTVRVPPLPTPVPAPVPVPIARVPAPVSRPLPIDVRTAAVPPTPVQPALLPAHINPAAITALPPGLYRVI